MKKIKKNKLSHYEKYILYEYENSYAKNFADKIDENLDHPRMHLEKILYDNGWMDGRYSFNELEKRMSTSLHFLCSIGVLWDNEDGTFKLTNLIKKYRNNEIEINLSDYIGHTTESGSNDFTSSTSSSQRRSGPENIARNIFITELKKKGYTEVSNIRSLPNFGRNYVLEVSANGGFADLITFINKDCETVYEVKIANNWVNATGQLIRYRGEFKKADWGLVLFGLISDSKLRNCINSCDFFNIKLNINQVTTTGSLNDTEEFLEENIYKLNKKTRIEALKFNFPEIYKKEIIDFVNKVDQKKIIDKK